MVKIYSFKILLYTNKIISIISASLPIFPFFQFSRLSRIFVERFLKLSRRTRTIVAFRIEISKFLF